MRPSIRIRSARAREIFAALENVKLDAQRRSKSASAEKAATVLLSRDDRSPGSRTAKPERQRSAQVSLYRAGAARLPVANAFHHECRPLEIVQRHVRSSAVRLRCESFSVQRDPAPPGMHRSRAKEIPAPEGERIPPSSSNRFSAALLRI